MLEDTTGQETRFLCNLVSLKLFNQSSENMLHLDYSERGGEGFALFVMSSIRSSE